MESTHVENVRAPAKLVHHACRLRRPSAGRLRGGWAVAGLLCLVGLSLAVRIGRPTGWLGSDDVAYYSAAEHLLAQTPIARLHHQYSRLAVIVPVAASVAAFGHHPVAVWLPMLLASLACLLLVALLGRVLWGWREGLLAGFIMSFVPYFRILSTAAFPDVHACLWTTGAVLLAILALRGHGRSGRTLHGGIGRRSAMAIACGVATGLAISTKLFCAPVIGAIGFAVWFAPEAAVRGRLILLGRMAAGGLLFFAVEGAFYQWMAGDFFYTWHAHVQATGLENPTPGAGGATLAQLAWQRVTMPLETRTSGWGTLGALFWPVMLIGFFERRTRILAIWGLATYLAVAFAPVGLDQGIKLNPLFHGRHVLPVCIPFALCLARFFGRLCDFAMRWPIGPASMWPGRLPWGICLAAILLLAWLDRHQLNGFCDRDTRRIGEGITQIVAQPDWRDDRPIFMSPSLYWRYRILFPAELRERLRVAADERSSDWWKWVCGDIAGRQAALPPPDRAYLLATPRQISGHAEHFDYDVRLPEGDLAAWQANEPLLRAARIHRAVRLAVGSEGEAVVVLLGSGPAAAGAKVASSELVSSPQTASQPTRGSDR